MARLIVDILLHASAKSDPLSAAESTVLEAMGQRPASTAERVGEGARTAGAWQALLAGSLEGRRSAADFLRIDATRVSQLTSAERIYTFTYDGATWYPRWQFPRGRVLDGMDAVTTTLRRAHPLTVAAWVTTPHDHLVLDGGMLSPADWLSGGQQLDRLADLASFDLG